MWQAHPFSFSVASNAKELRITPKQLGDFTNGLHHLEIGTRVIIDGPHGAFVAERSIRDKVVCIAGGIGITPIRALIEELRISGKEVVLLYNAKTIQDFVFRHEFENMMRDGSCTLHCIASDDAAWTGLRGKVDKEMLMRLVPDIASCDVYVCGPIPMLDSIRRILKKLKLSKRHILFEKFAL